MINKNKIRKIILEELLKKINSNKIIKEAALNPLTLINRLMPSNKEDQVKSITTKDDSKNIYSIFKRDVADIIDNAVIIEDREANILANRMVDATLKYSTVPGGRSLTSVVGLGTDEDEVKQIIEDSLSQIEFAKVCLAFPNFGNGASFDTVYKDELAGITGAQDDYVITPIQLLPYIRLEVDGQIKGLSKEEFEEELKKAMAEGSQNGGGSKDELSWGLDRPYVKNIIRTLNAYAEDRNLPNYTPCSGTTWTPAVQQCWLKVTPHALLNCDKFEPHTPNSLGGVADWNKMSDQLRSEFPGYVRGPRGCLAFLLDAYYCEIRFGNTAGSGGSGGGGTPVPSPAREQKPEGQTGGSSLLNKVNVKLNQEAGGFDPAGFKFKDRPDESVNLRMAEALIQGFNQRAQTDNVVGGSIVFYFYVNDKGDEVEDVKLLRLRGGLRNFMKSGRLIEDRLKPLAKRLKFPSDDPYKEGGDSFDGPRRRRQARREKRAIQVTFTLDSGSYQSFL